MSRIVSKSKSIILTGHSIGGAISTLCALWLLSSIQSKQYPIFCITFGSPLIGNASLSKAISRQKWDGKFLHLVSKHDLMPRLSFAPPSLNNYPLITTPQPIINILLRYWNLSITSPHLGMLATRISDTEKSELFQFVLGCLEMTITKINEGGKNNLFWPFGTFFFCGEEGAICLDNATSVVKMMYLLLKLSTSSPSSSIEDDHLKYGDYVGRAYLKFLNKSSFTEADLSNSSSHDVGISLALQSLGISSQEPMAVQVKECLKNARKMGLKPNLNAANLAVELAKIAPLRAQIEWYIARCEDEHEQKSYYDVFKQSSASKREAKVNINRIKLGQFWDDLIEKVENNELPPDFDRRDKWVNASQFYKLLFEPLEIANYYRTSQHRVKGHYLKHGRARRYEIFDRWWQEREVNVEKGNVQRTRFASSTQDSCFWARVEEARDWLDNVRSESDVNKLAMLWENINKFEDYARGLVERKEVCKDVVARNSTYSLWVEDLRKLKLHMQ